MLTRDAFLLDSATGTPSGHHYRPHSDIRLARSNRDFDPLTKRVQESEQPVDAVALDAPANEGGYLRLVQPKQLRGLRLSEFPLRDEIPDALDEFGFGEGQVGVGKAKVSEHVPASTVDGTGCVSRHLASSVSAARSTRHSPAPLPSAGF